MREGLAGGNPALTDDLSEPAAAMLNVGNASVAGVGDVTGDVERVAAETADDGRDDLRLVAEAVGERRTQRAVDEAAGEDRLLGGAPCAAGACSRCGSCLTLVPLAALSGLVLWAGRKRRP